MGGKRADMDHRRRAHATLWLCNQCNGSRDLIEIAERSGMPIGLLREIATDCLEKDLFEEIATERGG